jgi:hypothetical protein
LRKETKASEALRASRKSFLDVPYGDRERTKIDLYPADMRRRRAWSSCTAATGSAIRMRCLPCWSKASRPMAGALVDIARQFVGQKFDQR